MHLPSRPLFWLTLAATLIPAPTFAADARIDCRKPSGSIETLICQDPALLEIDRKLAGIYSAARQQAGNEHPPLLRAEQRGWIKGRNECWKSDDRRACVVDTYRQRTVELQARYRLVAASPPVRYRCSANPADEVVATYFRTDPPSLIAERGDQTSLMLLQASASGSRYVGRNEMLWEHQGQARIRWGYQAPELNCEKLAVDEVQPLAGTRWQLRALQSMDDAQGTTTVGKPARYTVHFGPDGRASFRLDCNRGTGKWQGISSAADSGALNFGPLATTRALCPPGSLAEKLTRQLPHVRSYLLKDGQLFMSLQADGGILHWEKQAGAGSGE